MSRRQQLLETALALFSEAVVTAGCCALRALGWPASTVGFAAAIPPPARKTLWHAPQ